MAANGLRFEFAPQGSRYSEPMVDAATYSLPFWGRERKVAQQYTIQQQRQDKLTLDRTIAMLSARIIGERQEECEENVLDYVRIARLWCNKPFLNHAMQVETAKMFQELAYAPRINAWQAKAYENLLKQTRRMVSASIFRRKGKQQVACLQPDVHFQPCFCQHLKEAQLDPTTA